MRNLMGCFFFLIAFVAIAQNPETDATLYLAIDPKAMQLSEGNAFDQLFVKSVKFREIAAEFPFSLRSGIPIEKANIEHLRKSATMISGDDDSVRKLENIFKIELGNPNEISLHALKSKLETLDFVRYCHLVMPVSIPPPSDISPITENLVSFQNYIGPNPGINMQYAIDLGITGTGIRIRDVEYGFNKLHEEFNDNTAVFLAPGMTISSELSVDYTEHGTAVAGIMIADPGTYGISGLAYGASEFIVYPEFQQSGPNRILAVSNAISNSQPGDVILYEMQEIGQTQTGYVPAEYNPVIWDLTKAATDSGIAIVGASGNGNQNLDAAFYAQYMARGDSGAILVGAGTSNLAHNRIYYSTYGTRINLQGWAQNVYTSGYGDWKSFGSDFNQGYTNFGGSSSATPIVASCVVALQSHYHSLTGNYLTPLQIRDLLIQTGIPQGTGGHIGPLPNVQSAILALNSLLVNESQPGFDFYLFPNPAFDTLNLAGAAVIHGTTAEIYDLLGQRLLRQTLGSEKQIDVSDLKTGVYVIQIDREGRSAQRKFVKK